MNDALHPAPLPARKARRHAGALFGFLVGALFGLMAGLAPGAADAAAPQTQACPAPAATSAGGAGQHWASPAEANNDDKAPQPCASCAEPANAGAGTCAVYRFLASAACADGRCRDAQGEFVRRENGGDTFFLQHDTRFRDPIRFARARGENCRVLLWAIEPVVGIEDVPGYSGRHYWQDAYVASQRMVEPPFAKDDVAFAIQPATTRGQHQFHIHIGTLKPDYRAALAALPPDATHVRIGRYDFHARFIAVPAGVNPFAGIDVLAIARSLMPRGAADLPLHGVLATVTEGGRGLWILTAPRFERSELNYARPAECRLN